MNPKDQHNWWLTFSKFHSSREKTWAPIINKVLQKQIQPTVRILREQGLQSAIAQYAFNVPMEGIATVIKNIYIDAGTVFGGKTYQMIKQQADKLQSKKTMVIYGEEMVNEITKHYQSFLSSKYEEKRLTPIGFNEEMVNEITRHYQSFLSSKYEEKRLVPIGFNEEMINAIIQHYQLFLLSKAVLPITQTTKEFILKTLIEAQQKGWSIQMVVDKLQDTDISRNRARTIARTETGKASSYAAITAARKSGYAQNKIWIASKDFRTRRIAGGGQHEHDTFDHYQMNGVMIPLNDMFHVPKKTGGYELMDHPHDPNGSAGDVVRCRCTIGFRILTDNAGRPLRN